MEKRGILNTIARIIGANTKKNIAYSPARIYADAAASTPLHPRVQARLVRLLALYANPGALHKEAVATQSELEKARAEIAEAIGAHADEIYFTASGTEANNLAIIGTLRPLAPAFSELTRGDKKIQAITLNIEHKSILEPLAHMQRYGVALSIVPVESDGVVNVEKIAEAIRPDTALISIQFVNNEIGTIQPLREITKLVRRVRKERDAEGNKTPLLIHTDSAQAPMYLPLRVESLGVDMMTLDAQKIMGPKSIGALYVRRGVSIEPIMFGGSQEKGLRPGTPNVALAGAFAEALTLAQKDVENRAQKVSAVRDFLMQKIRVAIPEAEFNGSFEKGKRSANNLNISIPGLDGETAVIALDALGVCASTRSACSTGTKESSYVLNALNISQDRAKNSIRFTLLPTATKAEMQFIVTALVKARTLYGKSVQ